MILSSYHQNTAEKSLFGTYWGLNIFEILLIFLKPTSQIFCVYVPLKKKRKKQRSNFDHMWYRKQMFPFGRAERQFCLKGDGTTDTMGTKKHVHM